MQSLFSVSVRARTYFSSTIFLNIEPQHFIFLPCGRTFLHQGMRLKEIYFHLKQRSDELTAFIFVKEIMITWRLLGGL